MADDNKTPNATSTANLLLQNRPRRLLRQKQSPLPKLRQSLVLLRHRPSADRLYAERLLKLLHLLQKSPL